MAEDEDIELSQALGALANPVRLALLRRLRTAKILTEIEVEPLPEDAPRAGRVLARQSVKQHLDKLIPSKLVVSRSTERDRGPTLEYVLNHQRLFDLSESLRELAKLRPAAEPTGLTVSQPVPTQSFELRGPGLVVVKGLEEGRLFELNPPKSGRKEWLIGRRRGLPVSLDFDAAVSSENSVVVWENRAYRLEDLRGSRNGTSLNFKPLPKGGGHPLSNGDVVGVGRSLLLFRA